MLRDYYYNMMYVRLNTMTNRDINKVRKRVLIIVQIWQPRKPRSGKTVRLTK